MRFRVLGPVGVDAGARGLPLGGYRQRLVLALLLSRVGESLSADWLVDAVWGEHPPRTARKTLQVYVARLRAVLGEDAVTTGPGGYRLDLRDAHLDAQDFVSAADRGHLLLAEAPARALDELSGALGLWRGPPFGDMADEVALQAEVQRLRERRLVAIEDRTDAEQALAHSPALAAELAPLLADHPGRARLRAALMLNLYRSGRAEDALALFDEARRHLADELGADPDPVLSDLHARILRRDPTLDAPAGAPQKWAPSELDQQRRNPYKGLHAFETSDADDFFGRSALAEALEQAVDGHSLVVLVGASGTGKSSAARAGLVPRLLRRSPPWTVVTMTPGAHPFEALREAARDSGGADVAWYTDDLDVLRTMQALAPDEAGHVLLVVDQAEELITQSTSEAAARFVTNLVSVAEDPAAQCTVLATVRADFTDRLLAHPLLAAHVADSLVTVAPMNPSEVTEATIGPARRVGLSVEPELVAELVADVTDQPGALPLFEYALAEMCRDHVGSVLSREAYRRLGGLRGALARRAEQTYQALEPDEQAAARASLLRLVAVTEDGAVARQRASRSALESLDPRSGTAIDAFDRARLLTFDRHPGTGEATVEVAHEALIREWPRLASWVEESRDDLRLARLLDDEVAGWQAAEHDQAYLMSGSRLAAYDDWPQTPAVSMTDVERDYLSSGRRQRERRAVAERRTARRLRSLVAATTVVALLASVLAVVAVQRAGVIASGAAQARARDLAGASASLASGDTDLALLLAMEASRLGGDQVPQAVSALHAAVSSDRLLLTVDEGDSVAFLPDGHVLVGGDQPRVIDTATGRVESVMPGASSASHVVASVDGRWAAMREVDRVTTWDMKGPLLQSAQALDRPGYLTELLDLAMTDDGSLVATHTEPTAEGLSVIDTVTAERVARRLATGSLQFTDISIRFDRTGSVVWRTDRTRVMSLDLATQIWAPAVTGPSAISDIDQLADGLLLTAGDDGWLRRWTSDGTLVDSVRIAGVPLLALAVDRTTDQVAIGDSSGVAHVWQPEGRGLAPVTAIRATQADIVDIEIRDGLVAAADSQRRVRVWTVAKASELGRWPGGGAVAISPDGTVLAAAAQDGSEKAATVVLRSMDDGTENATIAPPEGATHVAGMAYSDDGSRLVVAYGWKRTTYSSGNNRDTVTVIDAATGDVRHRERDDKVMIGDIDVAGHLLALPFCVGGAPAAVLSVDWSHEDEATVVGRIGTTECGHSVALSHDLTRYAALTSSGLAGARVYDITSEEESLFVPHKPLNRGSVRFSPDDRWLLTAGADGAARVWDSTTGEERVMMVSVGGAAETALWADSETIVSSHTDGKVRVWDVTSGRLLAEVGDAGVAPFIAVSSDGRRLVTSAEGESQVWTLDVDELLEMATAKVSRTFTTAECQRYGIDPCPAETSDQEDEST
ncbi:MAG: BTAD domain-containing putative transcriptional regulator [Jiangellales bacterium]